MALFPSIQSTDSLGMIIALLTFKSHKLAVAFFLAYFLNTCLNIMAKEFV